MKTIFFVIFILGAQASKISGYGEKQIANMLNNYFKSSNSISKLLGYHFYKENDQNIFQLEIKTEIKSVNSAMVDAFFIINKLANISKNKFTESIVIIHFGNNFLPVIAKSNIQCSKQYFIKESYDESQWRKHCLTIQNK